MNKQFNALALVASFALSGQVLADTTWMLNTTNAATGGAVTASGTAITGTVTGWADTSNDATRKLEQQTFTNYPGLGIYNKDACGTSPCDASEMNAPEHAIDNNGRYEMAMLSFTGGAVNLKSANFSYTGNQDSSSYRSNYTVLAYTGVAGGESLAGKTWGNLTGWTLVGNYTSSTTGDKTFNNAITSSFWLIGAYNPLGGASDSTYGSYSSAFKLASVSGTLCTPGTPGCGGGGGKAPEPGSMALMGLGLLGLMRARKSLKK